MPEEPPNFFPLEEDSPSDGIKPKDPYDSPLSEIFVPDSGPEESGMKLWMMFLWVIAIFFVWQLVQGIVLGAGLALSGAGLDFSAEAIMSNGDLLGAAGFISAAVACAMIVGIVKFHGLTLSQGLALRLPKKWWMWLLVIPGWLVGMVVISFLTAPFKTDNSVDDQLQMMEMVKNTKFLPLLVLGVSVGAPFFEEFFFRGFVHERLRQTFLGPWVSGALIGLVFSLAHQQYQAPGAFVALFLLGMLFTVARELSGSLWLAIAMHAVQNSVVTLSLVFFMSGSAPEEMVPEEIGEALQRLNDGEIEQSN